MTESQAYQAASMLKQPSPEAINEYGSKSGVIVGELNAVLLGRSDLETIIGNGNEAKMKLNHFNHARFMHSVFKYPNTEALVYTIGWVFSAYQSRGFTLTYWEMQITLWINLLEKHLSNRSFQEILPYYHWLQNHIGFFSLQSNSEPEDNPFL